MLAISAAPIVGDHGMLRLAANCSFVALDHGFRLGARGLVGGALLLVSRALLVKVKRDLEN